VFLDVDTGGGRTGIPAHGVGDALAVLGELRSGGFEIAGLHSYDGHLADLPESEQRDAVTAELHDLVGLAERLEAAGYPVLEIVAGGTHTFIPGARTEVPQP
jgi:D-serine deaminase-like pyridoxal phosphate-dependent protein